MTCPLRLCVLCLLQPLIILSAGTASLAQNNSSQTKLGAQTNQRPTIVTVRWGARPGVYRYRLQLSQDAAFADIVFDRVVTGQEYRIADLEPGKYFWRVAALGAMLGEFSSAGVIEVRNEQVSVELPRTTSISGPSTPNMIHADSGWYAAIGSVTNPVLAHLRSSNTSDVVGVNTEGRVFALDSATGVALWTVCAISGRPNVSVRPLAPIPVKTRTGLDNILILTGDTAAMLAGRSGREIWRSTLPGQSANAIALNSKLFVIDKSLQKLLIIDAGDGRVLTQFQLSRRAVGAPAPFENQTMATVMVALDDGQIEIIDQNGKVIRSGNAGSPATTSPLMVKSARGNLVLVGTASGLTALSGADLRPLGRVALKDEVARGTLAAQDLDGDGVSEVLMFTDRGRVVVVKSDEGKIIWEANAAHAGTAAFADINRDGTLDLLMAGREGFAFALSGRDGTVIWKDESAIGVAANHAPSAPERSAQVSGLPSGVLLIAADQNRGGLRAIEFPGVNSALK